MKIFVDTNYFLRLILNDIPTQHTEAKNLFNKGAENKVHLFTSTMVFFEIYWVITASYRVSKGKAINILSKILDMEFIGLNERDLLRRALKIFKGASVELEDCYNLTYMKLNNSKDIATFDTKLRRLAKSNNTSNHQ